MQSYAPMANTFKSAVILFHYPYASMVFSYAI